MSRGWPLLDALLNEAKERKASVGSLAERAEPQPPRAARRLVLARPATRAQRPTDVIRAARKRQRQARKTARSSR
jgi:hypothetical protein